MDNSPLDALKYRIWMRAFQARSFPKHGFLSRGLIRFVDPLSGKQFKLDSRQCKGHYNLDLYELKGKNAKGAEKWKKISGQLPRGLHTSKDEQEAETKIKALLKKYKIATWPMDSHAFK